MSDSRSIAAHAHADDAIGRAARIAAIAALVAPALGAQSVPRPADPVAAAATRVIWFQPRATPQISHGPCPAAIVFTSVINANRYPVTVEYQWERSDSAKGPHQSVTLTAPGTTVSTTWKLGAPGTSYAIFERVHVLSPNAARSGDARARVICAGAAGPALAPATPAADAQQGSSGGSGALTSRVKYSISYDYTETGSETTYRHVLVTLVRGQGDSARDEKDPVLTAEKRVVDSVMHNNTRRAMIDGIVYGGHWLWVAATNDSIFAPGHSYGRPGADTAAILMIDRGDRIGGQPRYFGTVVTTLGPMPKAYVAAQSQLKPDQTAAVLLAWLKRSPAVGSFLK